MSRKALYLACAAGLTLFSCAGLGLLGFLVSRWLPGDVINGTTRAERNVILEYFDVRENQTPRVILWDSCEVFSTGLLRSKVIRMKYRTDRPLKLETVPNPGGANVYDELFLMANGKLQPIMMFHAVAKMPVLNHQGDRWKDSLERQLREGKRLEQVLWP